MAKVYKTPGVYIQEVSSFPVSIVPVPTAVPAFIGYTEKAELGGKSLFLIPVKVSSLREYEELYGGAPRTTFRIGPGGTSGQPYSLTIKAFHFTLHAQLRMFFNNGGGSCYIVSVGGYTDATGAPAEVTTEGLRSGLAPLEKEAEPSLVVIPELTNLAGAYDDAGVPDPALVEERLALCNDVLDHCGVTMGSRFAILDVWMDRRNYTAADYDLSRDIRLFRGSINSSARQYGAAYYPYLETSIISSGEVSFLNVANPDTLATTLGRALEEQVRQAKITPAVAGDIKNLLRRIPEADKAEVTEIHGALQAALPTYRELTEDIRRRLNLLPPSAALAGIYVAVDNNRGVWKAPANVGVAAVVKPAVSISNAKQEDLNVPLDGLSVNAIRSFTGRGTLVWGARTLDGDSNDWRYINVRRTIIFIEQSVQLALDPFVFEPNDASSWVRIRSMTENFLTSLWQQGALAGARPEESFSVAVGLGTTMTAADVVEGNMILQVMVAITRPAEFIALVFRQKMQSA